MHMLKFKFPIASLIITVACSSETTHMCINYILATHFWFEIARTDKLPSLYLKDKVISICGIRMP